MLLLFPVMIMHVLGHVRSKLCRWQMLDHEWWLVLLGCSIYAVTEWSWGGGGFPQCSAFIFCAKLFFYVGERLSLDDDLNLLNAVYQSLWPIRAKAQQLGLALDIDAGTLDVFAKYSDDKALMEVIKVWLRRVNPVPTWKSLVTALRRENVGESALANKIARKHCPSEVEAGNCNNCL